MTLQKLTLTPIRRRTFLQSGLAALTMGILPQSGQAVYSQEKKPTIPYENNLRDRLWMWGHENAAALVKVYKIPAAPALKQAESVAELGIPNDCVIRWAGLPKPPFDSFIKQFARTKRVAWSIIDGAPESYEQKKKWAFELVNQMPNLTTFFLDDYFIGNAIPKTSGTGSASPAHLSVEGIIKLYDEMGKLARPIDLAIVLYSNQLHPGIAEHLRYSDVVSFWTWNGKDLSSLEKNFQAYRKIMPSKRTLLGLYLWDFGGGKPIDMELMKKQCEFALKRFKAGDIEGMIFHCTPLVGRHIEAVEYAKSWIKEHAEVTTTS